jgi:hypothetical protein
MQSLITSNIPQKHMVKGFRLFEQLTGPRPSSAYVWNRLFTNIPTTSTFLLGSFQTFQLQGTAASVSWQGYSKYRVFQQFHVEYVILSMEYSISPNLEYISLIAATVHAIAACGKASTN